MPGKVMMNKWLIVSEVRGVKSEMSSPNCEVRNPSDFTLHTSHLSLYPEPLSFSLYVLIQICVICTD